MKLLTFGEILWDEYPDKKYIGGAPFNAAAHFSKLGGESYMLSGVGNDALGDETLKKLNELHIKTSFISISKRATGRCIVSLDEHGIPSYNVLNDTAWDYIECDKSFDIFDAFYFGTLALRTDHNRNLLKKILTGNSFNEIFVDINIRKPFYTEEVIRFAFANATLLKISTEELPVVLNVLNLPASTTISQAAKTFLNLYPQIKCIVLTDGQNGAYAFDSISQNEYFCPALKVIPVSTVGAGDSFSAGFLYQYLHKQTIPFCLEYATKLAGLIVTYFDAVPDYDINF